MKMHDVMRRMSRSGIQKLFSLLLCSFLAGCGVSSSGTAPAAEYAAENEYMQAAVNEARKGIHSEEGGPFGAVVVKDGVIVGKGHNSVLAENDSTAHGEIAAIRNAEKKLGTYDLSGCTLYTTAEPCSMCLSAALWANIDHIYYGCTLTDTAGLGFRDEDLDTQIANREKMNGYLEELDREACLQLFKEYTDLGITLF